MAKQRDIFVDSQAAICRAVASDFKLRGLTHQDAADMLGVEKRTVSNQISGKRPFGKKSAKRYAEVFGYEEPFLLYGEGDLKKSTYTNKVTKLVMKRFLPVGPEQNNEITALVQRIYDLEQQVSSQKDQISRLSAKQVRFAHHKWLKKHHKGIRYSDVPIDPVVITTRKKNS